MVRQISASKSKQIGLPVVLIFFGAKNSSGWEWVGMGVGGWLAILCHGQPALDAFKFATNFC